MTTRTTTRKKSKPAAKHLVRKHRTSAKDPKPGEEEVEEGAGNNDDGAGNVDERELPEEMKPEAPPSNGGHRPPTNAVPDRPQDPARTEYKEPHPKDKIINTLGYDPNNYPYESPDFIDVSTYDIGSGRFQGAAFF